MFQYVENDYMLYIYVDVNGSEYYHIKLVRRYLEFFLLYIHNIQIFN